MANVKITDLAALTNPASTDVLPIVDVGADVTKKISIADLLENAGSGTASAPGIAFDGDPDTGIYRPGEDQVGIATNGSQALLIDAGGNVTAAGTSTADSFIPTSSSVPTNGMYLPATNSVAISTNGTGRLFVASDGRVAVGNSNPGAPFDVIAARGTLARFQESGSPFNGLRIVTDSTGVTLLSNSSTGYLGFNTGGTERLRITSDGKLGLGPNGAGGYDVLFNPGTSSSPLVRDSSGRLLVGTSSTSATATALLQGNSNSSTNAAALSLCRGSVPSATAGLGSIAFSDSGHAPAAYVTGVRDGGTWTSGVSQPSALTFSTTADGASSPTERMRITSAGAILIGTSFTSPHSTLIESERGIALRRDTGILVGVTDVHAAIFARYNSNGECLRFQRDNVDVGSIDVTTTATSYNTSSDYRLKENVVPLTGAVDRLSQLQVHRFNFIADPDTTVDGFLAHEAQSVVPECVTGSKDEVDEDGNPVYQGIDQSKLVPLLTAALQEALQKIETQAGVIAALDARLKVLEGN